MTETGPERRFLSYGGGTQSAALALMAAAGDLEHLDAVIFADTGGELPETYEYATYVAGELETAGIPFITVTAGNLEAALLATEPTNHNPTPPAHVVNPDGTAGRIGHYRCSYDYKRRIITAETKRRAGGRGAWKRSTVEQWLGFSADEIARCKPDDECRCSHPIARHDRPGRTCAAPGCKCERFTRWRINRFPLIELGFFRADTIRWFAAHGHPTPPRSACFFCPNSSSERWRTLRDTHPDLWARAVELDHSIRNGGGFNRRGSEPFLGKLYLHGDRVPLELADLRSTAAKVADSGQMALFDIEADSDCDSGVCFT